ncbi:hypothetical protein EDB83DRAFT_2316979 [Lactarius deliciosus]|nr:hypothetical protein EDB83DRAFT_2316979 [Lactarius deliciosus]
MHLAQDAWLEVDTSTIRHCWQKANILPEIIHAAPLTEPTLPISSLVHPQDPISAAEDRVVAALDELESTGALQRSNRMPLSDLLNPADEAHFASTTTDEEIFNAVMEAKHAQEESQSGQDESDDISEVIPMDPIPTRAEALRAAKTLSRYTRDKNDPFLQQLDSTLVTFGRRTRALEMKNMRATRITSYFV